MPQHIAESAIHHMRIAAKRIQAASDSAVVSDIATDLQYAAENLERAVRNEAQEQIKVKIALGHLNLIG